MASMQVLIVDDNPLNRTVLSALLGGVGASAQEAADAESGLGMLDGGGFDVVLMDLRMPGTDGLEAVRRIRAGAQPDMPVLVITADPGHDLGDACREAGADGLLTKPIDADKLFEAIGRIAARGNDALC